MILLSNSWALFLSGGELSPVRNCPRTFFPPFFSVLRKTTIFFLQMCFMRRTRAACPNMINFDVADFSEHRSEEVIIFLTLGVLCKKKAAIHRHRRIGTHSWMGGGGAHICFARFA